MLDTAGSMAFIIGGMILVLILLFILKIVHEQAQKVRELENRMKLMDNIEAPTPKSDTENTEVRN